MNELFTDSIRKSFGFNDILTDIFLSCKPKEIIGLFGRNGSGKSTLLKIISGYLKAESKFVRVNGKVCQTAFDSRGLIAYLPQSDFLPSHCKVKDLLSISLSQNTSETIAKLSFIQPHLDRNGSQLSTGQRRLIEITLILYSEATFILLDEPFNGLAPLQKDEIKEQIKLQSSEKGIILTDHDYRNVIDLSTRQVLLKNGQLMKINGISDLRNLGYLSF